MQLIEAFSNLAAVAIIRMQLAREARGEVARRNGEIAYRPFLIPFPMTWNALASITGASRAFFRQKTSTIRRQERCSWIPSRKAPDDEPFCGKPS